jgi:hypothetical protein
MEQKERIEQLEAEVKRLGGVVAGIERLPPDVAEEFLKEVIATEKSQSLSVRPDEGRHSIDKRFES